MNKLSKRNFLKIGLGLFTLCALFFILGSIKAPLTIELKKATPPFTISDPDGSSSPARSEKTADDMMLLQGVATGSRIGERVLLIGDSQLEGLKNPVENYCAVNKHTLVATVLWYGSSTRQWSRSDTLLYFLKKFKPTFVFIALGLNELFVTDMENRRTYVSNIVATIKKFGAKYYWLGPAAWKPDKGVIAVMEEVNGKYFYPSQKLVLERANDKMHPSRRGARIWFDSVAVRVTRLKKDGLDLSVKNDTVRALKKSNAIILNQM